MNLLTPAALEAAAKDLQELYTKRNGYRNPRPWGEIHEAIREVYREDARAAFNAIIAKLIAEGRAWTEEYSQPFDETKPRKRLVIDTGEP